MFGWHYIANGVAEVGQWVRVGTFQTRYLQLDLSQRTLAGHSRDQEFAVRATFKVTYPPDITVERKNLHHWTWVWRDPDEDPTESIRKAVRKVLQDCRRLFLLRRARYIRRLHGSDMALWQLSWTERLRVSASIDYTYTNANALNHYQVGVISPLWDEFEDYEDVW